MSSGMLYRVEVFNLEEKRTFSIFVKAYNFDHCAIKVSDYLYEEVGESNYEILSIKPKWNFLDAVDLEERNWTGECNDPHHEILHCVLDNIMEFKCSCGEEIRVADNGWESIKCSKCENWIGRSEVIREDDGKLYFVREEEQETD